MNWYVGNTGNHQGLVIEETTGRDVAVTYDKKDAPLVAAAPRLVETLRDMIALAAHSILHDEEDETKHADRMRIINAEYVLLQIERGEL